MCVSLCSEGVSCFQVVVSQYWAFSFCTCYFPLPVSVLCVTPTNSEISLLWWGLPSCVTEATVIGQELIGGSLLEHPAFELVEAFTHSTLPPYIEGVMLRAGGDSATCDKV